MKNKEKSKWEEVLEILKPNVQNLTIKDVISENTLTEKLKMKLIK